MVRRPDSQADFPAIVRSYTVHIRQTEDGTVKVMLSKLDMTTRSYRFCQALTSDYGWLTTSKNADLLRVAALMIEADLEANQF